MTEQQIEIYEYCKNHIQKIENWKEKLPFQIQQYGCGSQTPNIEHDLEKMHQEMVRNIQKELNKVKKACEDLIKEI